MKTLKKLAAILLVIVMIFSMFVLTASAAGTVAYGAGTVNASTLNIRSGPGTEYSISSTAPRAAILVILEKTSADWYKINYNGDVGYVASQYLTNVLTAENFRATGKVTGDYVRYRALPSTSGSILGSLAGGTTVKIIGINNGWYKLDVDGTYGYMRSDYIDVTSGSASAAGVAAANYTAVGDSALGVEIANYALQYVGYSYVYGAESPSVGFDCSGLVYYVFGQYGYSVSRTSSAQYDNNGVFIDKSELRAGDLVFFSSNGGSYATHVGIYIGDGLFVHASTSRTGVITSDLDSTYYLSVWYGAKRLV